MAVFIGSQHAEEHQNHDEALDDHHPDSEEPVLLCQAGGAVLTALTARPARKADRHGWVTDVAATASTIGTIPTCITHTHTWKCMYTFM